MPKCTRGGLTRAISNRTRTKRRGKELMFVTRHNAAVDRGLLERLWQLYELAYRRTAEESASREMFFRSRETTSPLALSAVRSAVTYSPSG